MPESETEKATGAATPMASMLKSTGKEITMKMEHNSPEIKIPSIIGAASEPLTMSSREISDLCEKRHPDVRRDIRSMVEGLDGDVSKFARIYIDGSGRKQEEYLLPKDLTLTLVAGYNVKLRKRIIDRWLELEGQAPALDYSSPQVILGVISTLQHEVAKRDAELLIQAPKVEAFDHLMNADGLYGLQNAGRALGARPNLFIRWMKQDYLFYQGHALVPRVQYIQRGYFEVKTTIVEDKARPTTFVTPKGLEYLRNHAPQDVMIGGAA